MSPTPSKSALLVPIVAVLTLISCRQKPKPEVDQPRITAGVSLQDVTFFSAALQREMQYRVLLPKATTSRKLPVVYLLHGGDGNFRNWSNYTDVSMLAADGFLLVMPQGDYSYYVNSATRTQDRYEDYIVNDLRADVENKFPARSDRGGRAIAGVSMGGYGAVKIALDHPEKFGFAAGLSSAIDVARRRFSVRRLDQSNHFREIFGPDGSETRRNADPFLLVARADAKKIPYLYLTCGAQEGLLAPNRDFAALLGRYGIAHEFHQAAGGHDWQRWDTDLPGLYAALKSRISEESTHDP